jgi:transcription termination factor NusB
MTKDTHNLIKDDFKFEGIDSSKLSKRDIIKCKKTALKVYEDREVLDHVIQSFAEEYPINQVSIIDKSLLRLAFWEVKYEKYGNDKAKLVEDFEKLGYLFGSDNSDKFIKGVTKSLIKKLNKIKISKKRKGNNGDN